MREIKFRAWDKDKLEMILPTDTDSMNYWDWVTGTSVEIVNNQLRSNLYNWMQYTGLKDKNGVEIYEGDVIKKGKHIMKIIFWEYYADDSYYYCEWAFVTDEELNNNIDVDDSIVEVIWNIYENPELLKDKE